MKNEEESYEKIIEMSKNNDYTTGNLLDIAYFKDNYRLIATDLSKQAKLKDPQQINFIGKLEGQYYRATRFSSLKNLKKLLLNFYKILSISYKNGNTKGCKFVKVLEMNIENLQQKMVSYWQWIKR